MGKIVAFWSSIHGQSGTTSNMIAIAISAALKHDCKCLLMQTHFRMNGLEAYLIGSRDSSRDFFLDVGIDGLARSMKLEPLDESIFVNYTIPIINKKLSLLPGTTFANSEMFKYDMAKTICKIMKEAIKYYDFVFIDNNSGLDEISKLVLNHSDLVVVNLCQNKSVLDHYFSTWKLKDRNLMYLIGSYNRNSSYNLFNLKALYKPLRRTPLSTIPYNTGFMDSLSGGEVTRFMSKHSGVSKADEDGYFMECVKNASDKLLKLSMEKKGGIVSGL